MCLVSYLTIKWLLPYYCRGLEKDFQQLQFKFQTLNSNFTVGSTINICSIYEDRMHFVSMPRSHIWQRFPVTSASSVQVYIRVPTDEFLSSKKKKGCTTWHHLWIINGNMRSVQKNSEEHLLYDSCVRGGIFPSAVGSTSTTAQLNTKLAKC